MPLSPFLGSLNPVWRTESGQGPQGDEDDGVITKDLPAYGLVG
jgi:hypothetical protein